MFEWQKKIETITTYSDSDWAGCAATCRSTSGGIVCLGDHVVKSYSRQQRTVALSSAEAELHAMVAASAETLGIAALMKDMGRDMYGEVYSDSSAALGIAQRQGIGKLRHIRTQALWVQEVRAEGRLGYKKVLGSRNPSDALTKYMASPLLEQHLKTVGMISRGGRAESAPTIDSIETYTEGWVNKRVRFHGKVGVMLIPFIGRGRKVTRNRSEKWHGEFAEHIENWDDNAGRHRGGDPAGRALASGERRGR